MNNIRIHRASVLAILWLAASGRAQTPSPSPTLSARPTVSPAAVAPVAPVVVVTDPPLIAEDLEAAVEAKLSAADIERAATSSLRDAEVARLFVEANRTAIEQGALQAARSMAALDETRLRAPLVERLAATEALRAAALKDALDLDATSFEDQQDAEAEAREKALEAREKARAKQLEAQEKAREKQLEAREEARERQQEAQERAREARERAREKAARDRERARSQRGLSEDPEDLFEMAMESIDDEDWGDALSPLDKLVSLNQRVDSALYWTGYAQGKMDRTAAALASLARLQKEFPTSRWAREGKALELEIRGKSGQVPRPDQEDDLDLKLMAVSALAQSDPQEAMPVLGKILASPQASRRVRERALFVLAQMGSEQAGNAIADVARGNSSPELQRKAIQYLGVFGGAGNRKVLSDIYDSTTDSTLRKQILNSFMVSGDKARVLSAAKTEKDPALRAEAVKLLGVMGGTTELSQMYATATTSTEKKAILHALFIGGAVDQVAAAAKGEKDKDVRLAAVRNLGLMGRKSQDVLSQMYRIETDATVKKEVLNAFFLQNNATRLVEIARVEKDPTLKKDAVHWLSLMNSKESRAYMIELLKD